MTTALACPDCRAPLTGEPDCPACGLTLTGALAQRLWDVDVALAEMDGRRHALQAERASLLARLRRGVAGPARVPAPPAAEASPRSAQNVLLALGALLLGVAATVFTAVTYDRLGAGGRAAVLLTVTALAVAAVPPLLRRGLSASAETVAGVAVVLGALDAYGLRTLGLGRDLAASSYAAGAAVVLAGLCLLSARLVAVRLLPVAAALLAHLAALLLVDAADLSAGGAAVLLVLVAGADLALLQTTAGARLPMPTWLRWLGVGAALAGLLAAAGGVAQDEDLAVLALLLLAALCTAAAARTLRLRMLLTAAGVLLVGAAAWAGVRAHLDAGHGYLLPLVTSAVALVAALSARGLPASWRRGPLLGAASLAGVGLLTQTQAVLESIVLPAGWSSAPWTRQVVSARAALAPDAAWTGTAVALPVVAATGLVLLTAAWALERRRLGIALAAPLAVECVVLAPLALDLSYRLALGALLAAAAVLVAVAWAAAARATARVGAGTGPDPARRLPEVLHAAAGIAAGYAALWSLADRPATLVVLPVTTALAAAVATRPGRASAPATAAAALLTGATLAAHGAARGLAAEQIGGLLVALVAVLVTLPFSVAGPLSGSGQPVATGPRHGAEAAAAALAVVAVLLASEDPGYLSWSLAGLGLTALAAALSADRRVLAPAGALLLAASSWVRLVEAGVTAPEPYVVPLGLLALLLGHLRRRQVPATGSLPAYGPGLSLLLVPSLVAALEDQELVRPLLLGLLALLVLLVGVRTRLRAPLLFGGAVLSVDAVHLLAPYAAALPRWLPLALTGALLLGLGATYEQRLLDLHRLRARLAGLA